MEKHSYWFRRDPLRKVRPLQRELCYLVPSLEEHAMEVDHDANKLLSDSHTCREARWGKRRKTVCTASKRLCPLGQTEILMECVRLREEVLELELAVHTLGADPARLGRYETILRLAVAAVRAHSVRDSWWHERRELLDAQGTRTLSASEKRRLAKLGQIRDAWSAELEEMRAEVLSACRSLQSLARAHTNAQLSHDADELRALVVRCREERAGDEHELASLRELRGPSELVAEIEVARGSRRQSSAQG